MRLKDLKFTLKQEIEENVEGKTTEQWLWEGDDEDTKDEGTSNRVWHLRYIFHAFR